MIFQEAKKKSQELDERRRRLREMRESIADEASPARPPPPKPARTFVMPSSPDYDAAAVGSDSSLGSEPITDNSSVQSLHSKNALSEENLPPHEQSMEHNVVGDVEDSDIENKSSSPGDNVNLNTPDQATEKVASKHLAGLVSDNTTTVFVDSVEFSQQDSDERKENPKLETPEPDIVQSTKPRSEPPPRPVAPPRRRKQNKGPPPPRPPPPPSAEVVSWC